MKRIHQAVSKIDAGYERQVTIGSWEADFSVKVLPPASAAVKPLAKATSKAKAKPGRPTKQQKKAQLLQDIKKTGFEAVTDEMEISNITRAKPAVSSKAKTPKKGFYPQATAAQITVEASGDEVLVALEYHPTTGEIIDWHYPAQEVVSEKKSSPSAAGLQSKSKAKKSLQQRQVVFEFPLDNAYAGKVGQLASPGMASKSLFKKLKKVVQIFSIKRIKEKIDSIVGKALGKLIKPIDKLIVRQPGLKMFDRGLNLKKVVASDRKAMKNKRVCLFVHGVISSTEGAFGDLAESKAYYSKLSSFYGGRLIAYDHWTLSESTEENAIALARSLPHGVTLDIVCHSRGASVVRSLLELPAVSKILAGKGIEADNVCFVAGACEGSPLAEKEAIDRLFNILNKVSVLTGKGVIPATAITMAIKLILGGLQKMPGTDPLDPDGNFIKRLNKSGKTLANRYLYFRANFDSTNTALRFLDEATIDRAIFENKGNDVIVPFAGAGKSDNYLKGAVFKKDVVNFGAETTEQSAVWHITFFGNKELQTGLQESLGF